MLCGDEAYRCFGVETGCAEAGERAGVARDFRLLSQRWGCIALKSAFAVRTSGLREKRGGMSI